MLGKDDSDDAAAGARGVRPAGAPHGRGHALARMRSAGSQVTAIEMCVTFLQFLGVFASRACACVCLRVPAWPVVVHASALVEIVNRSAPYMCDCNRRLSPAERTTCEPSMQVCTCMLIAFDRHASAAIGVFDLLPLAGGRPVAFRPAHEQKLANEFMLYTDSKAIAEGPGRLGTSARVTNQRV